MVSKKNEITAAMGAGRLRTTTVVLLMVLIPCLKVLLIFVEYSLCFVAQDSPAALL